MSKFSRFFRRSFLPLLCRLSSVVVDLRRHSLLPTRVNNGRRGVILASYKLLKAPFCAQSLSPSVSVSARNPFRWRVFLANLVNGHTAFFVKSRRLLVRLCLVLCRLSWLTKVGGGICNRDTWAGATVEFLLFNILVASSTDAHFFEALIEVWLSTLSVGNLHDRRILDLERILVRISGLHIQSGGRSHICDQARTLNRLRLIEKVERSRSPS